MMPFPFIIGSFSLVRPSTTSLTASCTSPGASYLPSLHVVHTLGTARAAFCPEPLDKFAPWYGIESRYLISIVIP